MASARTLLLTRPQQQSEAFAAELARRLPGRFRAIVAPLLRIAPLPGPLDLSGAQGLIFTSANGVAQFAAQSPERSLPAWCVGEMTAAAARRIGLRAHSANGDVIALAALIIAAHRPGAGSFVHLRGSHAAGDLIARLTQAGLPARAAVLYDQQPCALTGEARDLLAAGRAQVIAVFSPRSAAILADQTRAQHWDLAPATSVSLSPAADAALGARAAGRRIVADAPTREGMIAALARL